LHSVIRLQRWYRMFGNSRKLQISLVELQFMR